MIIYVPIRRRQSSINIKEGSIAIYFRMPNAVLECKELSKYKHIPKSTHNLKVCTINSKLNQSVLRYSLSLYDFINKNFMDTGLFFINILQV
ncbi:hypothetical protein HS7_09840 [Sulfolobales archaeon HS-7]|nr:hypothetical protein HS7_09840 [Sulfolobales archaeon HS-7]